jgi:putative PIG3 family NAD(P)H quinone oxidoreductase
VKQIVYGPEGTPESMRLVSAVVPQPRTREILIDVHCAGVNRPDLLQRAGRYAPPPDASPILGLEVAGTVAALGEGVTQWQLGDRVTALTPGGGYAEQCVAPASHALPVPSGLSMAEAAALPETWFTVWANLVDLGRLKAGERVLVHGGSSGIGLTAIQLAKFLGASVLVTVGNADKAAFCSDFGADLAINYRAEDFVARVKAFTAGEGVDVVLDMVGGGYLPRNASVLRRDGRMVLIAFLEGSRVEFDFMPVMLKRLTITGSAMRPRSVEEKEVIRDALLARVWPEWTAGRLRPHLHACFPLAQAADAHRLMASSQHIGKIVLSVKD